jgi:hypothetical protein
MQKESNDEGEGEHDPVVFTHPCYRISHINR